MRDMLNNKQVVHLGNLTLSGTTPATSAYVDLRGYDAATIVVINNTVTDAGTASGFTVTLQESADTAAASAGTVATGETVDGSNTVVVTSDSADDTNAGGMGYRGDDRYVGVSAVGTTGTDADITILAVLNIPHRAPATFVGTSVART